MALTAREIEQNQRARQREQNRQNLEARDDFLASKQKSILANPGGYSPFERRAVEEEINGRRLREHELDLLDKKNAGELALQQERTRTAGEAARQSGLTQIELSRLQDGFIDESGNSVPGSKYRLERERINAGLSQAEREFATRERIADLETKRRYGYFDEKGDYVGGSDFNAADVTGEHRANAAEAQAKEARAMKELDLARRDGITDKNNNARLRFENERAAKSDKKTRDQVAKEIAQDMYRSAGLPSESWMKMSVEEKNKAIDMILGRGLNADGTGRGSGGNWKTTLGW